MLFTDGGYYHPILGSVRTYIYAVEAWQLIHPKYRCTNTDTDTDTNTDTNKVLGSVSTKMYAVGLGAWLAACSSNPSCCWRQLAPLRENNCIIFTIFALIPDV